MNKDYVIQKKNILSGSKECVRRRMTRMKLEIDAHPKKEHLTLLGMAESLFFVTSIQGILKSSTDSAYYLSITCCNIFSS